MGRPADRLIDSGSILAEAGLSCQLESPWPCLQRSGKVADKTFPISMASRSCICVPVRCMRLSVVVHAGRNWSDALQKIARGV